MISIFSIQLDIKKIWYYISQSFDKNHLKYIIVKDRKIRDKI